MDLHDRPSLLTKLGLSVLTCNSALAVYQSHNDPASVAFVAGAYGAVVLLFHQLRKVWLTAAATAVGGLLAFFANL